MDGAQIPAVGIARSMPLRLLPFPPGCALERKLGLEDAERRPGTVARQVAELKHHIASVALRSSDRAAGAQRFDLRDGRAGREQVWRIEGRAQGALDVIAPDRLCLVAEIAVAVEIPEPCGDEQMVRFRDLELHFPAIARRDNVGIGQQFLSCTHCRNTATFAARAGMADLLRLQHFGERRHDVVVHRTKRMPGRKFDRLTDLPGSARGNRVIPIEQEAGAAQHGRIDGDFLQAGKIMRLGGCADRFVHDCAFYITPLEDSRSKCTARLHARHRIAQASGPVGTGRKARHPCTMRPLHRQPPQP